jgi:hypothetical protein
MSLEKTREGERSPRRQMRMICLEDAPVEMCGLTVSGTVAQSIGKTRQHVRSEVLIASAKGRAPQPQRLVLETLLAPKFAEAKCRQCTETMGICERGKHAPIFLLSLSVLTERSGAGSELKLHVRGKVRVAQFPSPCQRIPRLVCLPSGDQKPM